MAHKNSSIKARLVILHNYFSHFQLASRKIKKSRMVNNINESLVNKPSETIPDEYVNYVHKFCEIVGAQQTINPKHNVQDSFSNLIGGVLKVTTVQHGKLSCTLSVKAPILNGYGIMHGAAIGALANRVAVACARTVVGKDADLFLGELSISYLSAAPNKSELVIDASVIRSGRSLTVVGVDFRHKGSGRLAFMTRATFYNMPVSSL